MRETERGGGREQEGREREHARCTQQPGCVTHHRDGWDGRSMHGDGRQQKSASLNKSRYSFEAHSGENGGDFILKHQGT